MQWFVIIGVILAILAEFFTILYSLYEVGKELLRKKTTAAEEKDAKGGKIEMVSSKEGATDSEATLKIENEWNSENQFMSVNVTPERKREDFGDDMEEISPQKTPVETNLIL